MRKLLNTAVMDLKKIKRNGLEAKILQENLKSLIIKNINKFENEEIVKIIEKYNEQNYKDDKILKCSYDVFKNDIHRYSFDQINKILRLYNTSQINDTQFNTSVFNYIIKRLDAIPSSVSVNIFHNLVRSGLKDCRNVILMKNHFIKNIEKFNNLDLTIILNSFTILQEDVLKKSNSTVTDDNSNSTTYKNSLSSSDISDIFTLILNKIMNEEYIHNNLSLVNSVLILNMISRINICNYEIFKFFTQKYFKNLKEGDLEPHHFTLLLNSFAKCNIHINIMKYIVKYMNNDQFINQLSYVNITNAVHYMAKFNYKNRHFINKLKNKVIEIIDHIPQREFSNIMWSLSKLKVNDNYFYAISFQKIKKIVSSIDMMSIAQILDAMRRRKYVSNKIEQSSSSKEDHFKNGTTNGLLHNSEEYNNVDNKLDNDMLVSKKISKTNEKENKKINNKNDALKDEKWYNESDTKKEQLLENAIKKKKGECIESKIDIYDISEECEKEIIDLLIKKYLEHIESSSLHVITQVPFCCLQLDYINYDVYYRSLEVLKLKRKYMNTLNLIYAKYFIRIFIEKQENNFQKLPRHIKHFANDIMNSDN